VRRKASLITAHGQSPYFFPLDRRDRSERILSLVANKRATCPPTLPPCPPPPPPLPPLPRLVPPLSASCVFTVSLVYPADISPPPRSAPPPLSLSLSLCVFLSFLVNLTWRDRERRRGILPPKFRLAVELAVDRSNDRLTRMTKRRSSRLRVTGRRKSR